MGYYSRFTLVVPKEVQTNPDYRADYGVVFDGYYFEKLGTRQEIPFGLPYDEEHDIALGSFEEYKFYRFEEEMTDLAVKYKRDVFASRVGEDGETSVFQFRPDGTVQDGKLVAIFPARSEKSEK